MAILKRKSSKDEQQDSEGVRKFIDLNDYRFQEEKADARSVARVAEIRKLEDVRKIGHYIFEGDIMLIDCSPISSEEYMMKRVTDELRRMVRDSNGDVALVGKSFLLVTPPDIAIDRNRIKNL
jgi:SepF-like predicted cell division protein (DUF552 family)